jgi:hypothetical protein
MTAAGKDEPVPDPEKVGLPATPFFYMLDQVATMLGQTVEDMMHTRLFYAGRSRGRQFPRQLRAVNIAPNDDDKPDWRISEGELIRWCKACGFRVYSRGRVV